MLPTNSSAGRDPLQTSLAATLGSLGLQELLLLPTRSLMEAGRVHRPSSERPTRLTTHPRLWENPGSEAEALVLWWRHDGFYGAHIPFSLTLQTACRVKTGVP